MCSTSRRLAVFDKREQARLTEEVGTTPAKPKHVSVSQRSQCRSGQDRLLTSSDESPVTQVTFDELVPRIFVSGGSSSSLESS